MNLSGRHVFDKITSNNAITNMVVLNLSFIRKPVIDHLFNMSIQLDLFFSFFFLTARGGNYKFITILGLT